jgi:hypothetical protein
LNRQPLKIQTETQFRKPIVEGLLPVDDRPDILYPDQEGVALQSVQLVSYLRILTYRRVQNKKNM